MVLIRSLITSFKMNFQGEDEKNFSNIRILGFSQGKEKILARSNFSYSADVECTYYLCRGVSHGSFHLYDILVSS